MRPLLIAIASLALALGAAPASADDVDRILEDCQDGQLDDSYSARDISRAKRDIPTDIDEYTDCRDTLNRARLDAANSGSGGADDPKAGASSGSPGSGNPKAPGAIDGSRASLITPRGEDEARAVRDATRNASGDSGVIVDGKPIRPGVAGLTAVSGDAGVPAALVVVLVLLGLGAIGAALAAVKRDGLLPRRS